MIVLASTSLTRQTMLKNAGVPFTAMSPAVDERALVADHPDWKPAEIAVKLAEAKAIDVSLRIPDAIVIGADQVLALGDRIFSKPRDQQECRRHLMELRDKTHSLISGIVCARNGKPTWTLSDEALLTMRNFSDAFMDSYLDAIGNDCTTSVGGYKIEGRGLQLFETVKGDHFTILGLPLIPLLNYLRRDGEINS